MPAREGGGRPDDDFTHARYQCMQPGAVHIARAIKMALAGELKI